MIPEGRCAVYGADMLPAPLPLPTIPEGRSMFYQAVRFDVPQSYPADLHNLVGPRPPGLEPMLPTYPSAPVSIPPAGTSIKNK